MLSYNPKSVEQWLREKPSFLHILQSSLIVISLRSLGNNSHKGESNLLNYFPKTRILFCGRLYPAKYNTMQNLS